MLQCLFQCFDGLDEPEKTFVRKFGRHNAVVAARFVVALPDALGAHA